METDSAKGADRYPDGAAKHRAPIERLPPELLHKILHDPALIESLVTERPAETARNLNVLASISRHFRDALKGTPLGIYREGLNQFGTMAKTIYEKMFPEGPSVVVREAPHTLQKRLWAVQDIVGFRSDASQEALVDSILALPKKGPLYATSIETLTQSADYNHFNNELQQRVTRASFERARITDGSTNSFRSVLRGSILQHLQDEDIAEFCESYQWNRDKVLQDRQSLRQSRSDDEVDDAERRQDGKKRQAEYDEKFPECRRPPDSSINALGKEVEDLPRFERRTLYRAAMAGKSASRSVKDMQKDARRAFMESVRSREVHGR